jgi:type IV pilus assembly protein PilC
MKKNEKVKKLTSEELAYFCTQLALIMKSGINLNDGLVMMLDDANDSHHASIISKLSKSINEHKRLHVSLEETKAFPEYLVSMVEIGETSGHLESVLEGLAAHYTREANLKSSVKSAIMQPILLLLLMSAVVAVLLIKVLPIFKDVFVQINSQLSNASSAAIQFGTHAGVVVLIVIGIIILLTLLAYFISFTSKGKSFLMKVFSKAFYFRGLTEKISVSRFSSAMSLMLSSGFNNCEALSLGKNVVSNPIVKSKLFNCEGKLQNNESFAQAITETGLFPPIYAQLIRISYKSGALDSAWNQIAEKYDYEVNESLENLVSFIEPLLVGVLTIIIGVILVSVLLPLMGIMSSIG